ncbi:MAG: hypothetical protein ACKOOI_15875, partial [Pirellula sp.]
MDRLIQGNVGKKVPGLLRNYCGAFYKLLAILVLVLLLLLEAPPIAFDRPDSLYKCSSITITSCDHELLRVNTGRSPVLQVFTTGGYLFLR